MSRGAIAGARGRGEARLRARRRLWGVRWTIGLLFFLHLSGIVASQELVVENPNKVKAAFLRNFTRYVSWPMRAFPDSRSPWRICILGRDPFGEVLDITFKGRTEQERPFEIYRADTLNRLPECQIIYVSYDNPTMRRAVLRELTDKPVLTVGDAPEFLREGGVVRFQVGDRVGMSINLDQARASSLTIQTRMLEVSNDVLDNGVLRKVR